MAAQRPSGEKRGEISWGPVVLYGRKTRLESSETRCTVQDVFTMLCSSRDRPSGARSAMGVRVGTSTSISGAVAPPTDWVQRASFDPLPGAEYTIRSPSRLHPNEVTVPAEV